MTPRMGRPIKPDARREQITLRLRKETMEKLQECADRNGITRTEVVERGIEMVDKATKEK